ncbi:hypothetical protein ACP70R_021574 [Stipagrostis hirtigluma subsp. patula]
MSSNEAPIGPLKSKSPLIRLVLFPDVGGLSSPAATAHEPVPATDISGSAKYEIAQTLSRLHVAALVVALGEGGLVCCRLLLFLIWFAGSKMDSYLDLLNGNNVDSNEFSLSGSQFPSPLGEQAFDEDAAVEATPPVKGSKRRSKNFSVQEDILLVSAWLEISTDAVQGNEQSRTSYWQRIHDYFHEHKDFPSDRNANSLAHRWGVILESVNRFCGWYAQIENRRQSGVTEQDKVQDACKLYKDEKT